MIHKKVCLICEEAFVTGRKARKFCSKECSFKADLERRKVYIKEMRKIAIEIGDCPNCFRHKENIKYINCFKCREKGRVKSRSLKHKHL